MKWPLFHQYTFFPVTNSVLSRHQEQLYSSNLETVEIAKFWKQLWTKAWLAPRAGEKQDFSVQLCFLASTSLLIHLAFRNALELLFKAYLKQAIYIKRHPACWVSVYGCPGRWWFGFVHTQSTHVHMLHLALMVQRLFFLYQLIYKLSQQLCVSLGDFLPLSDEWNRSCSVVFSVICLEM